MSDIKFPYGYSGNWKTWEEMLNTTTVNGLQPEVLDRLFSLIHAAHASGVALGVGTGFRYDQPDKPGFAANGNSNHQAFEPPKNAVAIDMVPSSSWNWMEANAAKHGFRTFRYVNNEPWHIQPSEIPKSRNYRKEMWPLQDFNCPIKRGGYSPPPPIDGGIVHVTVTADPIELTPNNRDAVRGHPDTYFFQREMAGLFVQTRHPDFDVTVDGDYGPQTQQACKTFQAINGLQQDASCGQNTWSKLMNP